MAIYGLSAVGWTAAGVAFLIIWILIAFWPARVARRKGHSFIGYFIFSLIFFPLAWTPTLGSAVNTTWVWGVSRRRA
jgi:hypothetical protein